LVEVGFSVDVLAAGALSQWGKEQSSSIPSAFATSFEQQTDRVSTAMLVGLRLGPGSGRPFASTGMVTTEDVSTA
jgi:hypothetical protein